MPFTDEYITSSSAIHQCVKGFVSAVNLMVRKNKSGEHNLNVRPLLLEEHKETDNNS